MLVIALVGLSLAACDDDDLSTNQYGGGVQLNVYGPNPVMRGGVLRFIGSNLDQIAQVIIPGCDPITNIEVISSGRPSEIRVTLPKDGPEVGYVKLITKDGQEITTKTQLEYEEPIVLESFAPAAVMPGDVITIEGDYLNLVQMVCFTDEVWVSADDFISQDRYKLEVPVPEDAQTGVIALYTMDLTKVDNPAAETDYNIIESEDILEVGTPAVSKIASPRGEVGAQATVTAKQGETITITGQYFNLAAAVEIIGENSKVEITDIKVSDDGKSLSFTLPADAPDGQLNIICKSGVEVPVGTVATIAPSNLAAAPAPVKNLAQLTISGSDLDVVTGLTFPNVADPVEFEGAENRIIVTVPEKAQEGDITLTMANGKTVTVAYTLVKPAVTAYNVNPVSAGGVLTLTGTDLDLVESVTFGEATNEAGKFEATETTINLTVPMAATSGKPVLNLKNGTKVEAPELAIQEAVFCYITEMPEEGTELKAGATMSVKVANQDVLTAVQMNGTNCQYVLTTDGQLIIGIPEDAKAKSTLKLISSNGEIEYAITVIPASEVTTVVWSGLTTLTWSDGGRVLVPAAAFTDVPAGAIMTVCYSQIDQTWAQAQFNYGDWSGINFDKSADDCVTFNQTLVPTDVYGWEFADRETSVVLTQDILDNIQAKRGGVEDKENIGIIIQGSDLVFSKVIIKYKRSSEVTIWSGNEDMGNWSNQPYIGSDGGAEFTEYEVKAGQTLYFYGTATDADWGFQVFEGHWGPMYGDFSAANNGAELEADGRVSLEVTQAMIDKALTPQGWGGIFVVQGKNFILTQVTVE